MIAAQRGDFIVQHSAEGRDGHYGSFPPHGANLVENRMAKHGAEADLRHAPSARESRRDIAGLQSVACLLSDEFAGGDNRRVASFQAESRGPAHDPNRRDGGIAFFDPLSGDEHPEQMRGFAYRGRDVDGDA